MKKVVVLGIFLIYYILFAGCTLSETKDSKELYHTLTFESNDELNTFSQIILQVPVSQVPEGTQLNILSFSATDYDKFQNFLGGQYYLKPFNIVLNKPALVQITLFPAAFLMYEKGTPESEYTLAYYDNEKRQYFEIPSVYDKEAKTVTGEINAFYSGGLVVREKTK